VIVALVDATGMSMVEPTGCVVLQLVAEHADVTVPAHEPEVLQVSPVVQAMPSSHGAPAGTGVCVQPIGARHASVVHGLPSSQFAGLPPAHAPPRHDWPVTHALMLHAVPSVTGAWTQDPFINVSVVHGFMSSQLGV
jgi:hypothetical protein